MVEVPLAELEALAVDAASWPEEGPPEVALSGRSNVGKSTLLNTLCARRALARTSSTPGRTRALVFFRVRPQGGPLLRLVDLPGYGWARASKRERAAFRPLVERYLTRRPSLRLVLVLCDARLPAQAQDRELLEWLRALGRPARVVLTKLDELPRPSRAARLGEIARDLGLAAPPIGFSATEKVGREPLWRVILEAVQRAGGGAPSAV